MEEIGDLEGGEVFRLDGDGIFGYEVLQSAFGLNVASPKSFVEEEKTTVLEMTAKSADEVFWLRDG